MEFSHVESWSCVELGDKIINVVLFLNGILFILKVVLDL